MTEIADTAAGNVDLWIHDLERSTASRFTFDAAFDCGPVWTPTVRASSFTSAGEDGDSLLRKAASGTGATEVLLTAETNVMAGDIAPDGKHLLYMTSGEGRPGTSGPAVGRIRRDLSGASQFGVHRGAADAFRPMANGLPTTRTSPENKRFTYGSSRDPGGSGRLSTDGGSEPIWSADGSEIFYIDSGRNLVSVPVTTGDTLEAGLPAMLFDPPVFPVTQRERYVVTRDGQQFLMLSTTSGISVRPTTVVLNWDLELEN